MTLQLVSAMNLDLTEQNVTGLVNVTAQKTIKDRLAIAAKTDTLAFPNVKPASVIRKDQLALVAMMAIVLVKVIMLETSVQIVSMALSKTHQESVS